MGLATFDHKWAMISLGTHKLNNFVSSTLGFSMPSGTPLGSGVATYGRTGRFAFKLEGEVEI